MSKENRKGKKQKHGHSRAAYFAQAALSIARNKRRRAEKEARLQAKRREAKEDSAG